MTPTAIGIGIGIGVVFDGQGGGGAPILCTPAYVTGDRTASIAITFSGTLMTAVEPVSKLVDGAISVPGATFFNTQAAAGAFLKFDFGGLTYVTEAKWYQETTAGHGVWQWQGSTNDSDWVDIGSTFTLGGATEQTQTELNGNAAYYRYYRLLGVSGSTTNAPYIFEVEFSQCVDT